MYGFVPQRIISILIWMENSDTRRRLPPTLSSLFSQSQARQGSGRRDRAGVFFSQISWWGERGRVQPDTYQRHRLYQELYITLYTITTMCTPVQFSQQARQLCVGCEGVQLSQRPSDLYPDYRHSGLPRISAGHLSSEPDINFAHRIWSLNHVLYWKILLSQNEPILFHE